MGTLEDRIKRVRLEKGLSRDGLGDLVSLSGWTIGKYETNTRKPDLQTLTKLAKILGVSTDWLLVLTNARNYPDDYPAAARPDEPVDITVDNIRLLVEGYAEGLIRKRGLVPPAKPEPGKPKK